MTYIEEQLRNLYFSSLRLIDKIKLDMYYKQFGLMDTFSILRIKIYGDDVDNKG